MAKVTGGRNDPALTEALISDSQDVSAGCTARGLRLPADV